MRTMNQAFWPSLRRTNGLSAATVRSSRRWARLTSRRCRRLRCSAVSACSFSPECAINAGRDCRMPSAFHSGSCSRPKASSSF